MVSVGGVSTPAIVILIVVKAERIALVVKEIVREVEVRDVKLKAVMEVGELKVMLLLLRLLRVLLRNTRPYISDTFLMLLQEFVNPRMMELLPAGRECYSWNVSSRLPLLLV